MLNGKLTLQTDDNSDFNRIVVLNLIKDRKCLPYIEDIVNYSIFK